MKFLIFSLLLVSIALAEPQRPMDRILDPLVTMPIAIHPESTTLLVFPEAVTLIVGAGLSDGSSPGEVHYQHAKDPKHLVLRQLTPGCKVLMQIIMDGQAYAFALSGSEDPDNIIRFHQNPAEGPTVELTGEEVRNRQLTVPEERQKQLIRLVSSEAILRPKLPIFYEGYVARDVSLPADLEGLRTTVSRVARFAREDAVVLTGKIRNITTDPVDLTKRRSMVRVGEKQVAFPASYFVSRKDTLAPDQEVEFSAVLIGDGRGENLHLDPLKNRFLLTLNFPQS